MRFRTRADAGRQLLAQLSMYAGRTDIVVLALPRGGVPVAYEIAAGLDAPLDVCSVRKLGVPQQPELAMGSIAFGGVEVLDRELIAHLGVTHAELETVVASEREELRRRDRAFRGMRPPLDVRGKTVILVDDGLATGLTMEAAVRGVKTLEPAAIVVAVPVGSIQACERLEQIANQVVCLFRPLRFEAVGLWYEDFEQTSDQEVQALLAARTDRETP